MFLETRNLTGFRKYLERLDSKQLKLSSSWFRLLPMTIGIQLSSKRKRPEMKKKCIFLIQNCTNQFFVELSLSKSVKISSNFLFVTICQVIACRIGILNRSRVVLHQVYTLIIHLTPTNQHQFNVVKLI